MSKKVKVLLAPGMKNPEHASVVNIYGTDDIKKRFWEKVEKTEDCWLWTGRVNPCGLGQMRIRSKSRGAQGGTRMDSHRLAYSLFVGSIPPGMEIDHLCRVPHCVRPEHLEAVTPKENRKRARQWRTRDKLRKESLQHAAHCRARAKANREAKT